MSFRLRLKFFLVHTLHLSNKQADKYIHEGLVQVDGVPVFENVVITAISEIKLDGKPVRAKTDYVYLQFYKPVGFESSLNEGIPNNLSEFFKNYNNLAIAGRLDKQSEGLLLLSNDGKWVEDICNPKYEKDKEYVVSLDKPVSPEFISHFEAGVDIGNYVTKTCRCRAVDSQQINVLLTEGKNRQIRRMCAKLGYRVLELKRIRIDDYKLDDLQAGEWRAFYPTKL